MNKDEVQVKKMIKWYLITGPSVKNFLQIPLKSSSKKNDEYLDTTNGHDVVSCILNDLPIDKLCIYDASTHNERVIVSNDVDMIKSSLRSYLIHYVIPYNKVWCVLGHRDISSEEISKSTKLNESTIHNYRIDGFNSNSIPSDTENTLLNYYDRHINSHLR